MIIVKIGGGKSVLDNLDNILKDFANLKDKKTEGLKKMDLSKLSVVKYVAVKDICNMLGGKY